jgi:hypothetical protein
LILTPRDRPVLALAGLNLEHAAAALKSKVESIPASRSVLMKVSGVRALASELTWEKKLAVAIDANRPAATAHALPELNT